PIGASFAGRTFALWVQAPDRIGAIHCDGHDADDAATIASLFPLFSHPQLAPRYDVLQDLGDVTAFTPREFQFFDSLLRKRIDHRAQRVRRVPVVPPPGVVGAALTGMFHRWVAPRLDARLCETRCEAYAWLDMPAEDSAQIEALREGLTHPLAVRRLREAIG